MTAVLLCSQFPVSNLYDWSMYVWKVGMDVFQGFRQDSPDRGVVGADVTADVADRESNWSVLVRSWGHGT